AATSRSCLSRRCHLLPLLPASDGLLRALAGARVGLRALTTGGKAATVPEAAVAADLREALDRLRALAPQVALDLHVRVGVVAELRDLVVREILDLLVAIELERVADLLRGRLADPVDVREPDLETLLIREVDACDASQSLIPAFACAGGWCRSPWCARAA